MYASRVAVVDKRDVGREAVEHVYLVQAQGCAGVGHHVLDATLVHGYHVGLTLNHEHPVFLGYGSLGLPYAVQLMVLVEDLGIGRVDIFLVHALRALVEHARREAHHLAAHACPGKHHAAGIAVDELVALGLIAQAG